MTSRTSLSVALASLFALVPIASAQVDAGDTNDAGTAVAPLLPSDFAIYIEGYEPRQKAWLRLNATEQRFFFNRARCQCAGDTSNYTGFFKVAIVPTPQAPAKIQALLAANGAGTGIATSPSTRQRPLSRTGRNNPG